MSFIAPLLQLFVSFFKIGIISFGGGYAMIPLIEREIIEGRGWLTEAQFLDIIAVAEMTPGPIAVNSATYIGYQTEGILGAITATLGVVTPSFIAMVILAYVICKTQHLLVVKGALKAIVSGVVALIGFATIKIAISTGLFEVRGGLNIDYVTVTIALAAFALLRYTKLHPVLILIGFGFLGIIIY
ncbi:chromate transporter [Proteinivorax hydrogeniformans]|uniref:Chromate transporter n=1 Tax=Proteinivorax hydrogeniformans TaxID=1826727 RepID=A0AAU8HRU7_9FIRM